MTKEKHVLINFQEFEDPENVALGDGRVVKALGSGRVEMNMLFPGTEAKKAVLHDVLYVPKLTCNLFSVRAAVAKGNAVELGDQRKKNSKNPEDLREHIKHLSDMVMTNMQTPRPTACTMLPII